MKQKNDKVYLQLINMLMQIVFVFFSIFFSIYIYEMSKNINFVLGYNLFSCVMTILVEIFVVKILSKKNFNLLYRLSFLFAVVSIALIFTINSSTLFMVFVVQIVYSFARILYYAPHEVATMNTNNKKTITSFVGLSSILSLIASVLSPFISGYIIDYVSYYVLFGIIIVLAAICFGLSFGVKKGYIETPKIKYKNFFVGVHKYKRVRQTYFAYGLYKFSQNSVIDILLPLLLFLKVGTNFSVGLYSALATVASGLVLIIYLKSFKFKDVWFIASTALVVIASFVLTFWASLVAFFIYYFVGKCCRSVISHRIDQNIFTAIEGTTFEAYKKEHHLTFNLYDHIFKTIAYLIAFLIYNLMQNVAALSVIILVLSLVQIVSTALFINSDKLYDKEQTMLVENETEPANESLQN